MKRVYVYAAMAIVVIAVAYYYRHKLSTVAQKLAPLGSESNPVLAGVVGQNIAE